MLVTISTIADEVDGGFVIVTEDMVGIDVAVNSNDDGSNV